MRNPFLRLGAFAALGVTLLAGSAAAQVPLVPAQPDPNDPDATLVEELVVTARLPGPAWWRVSKGDSVVYVLGAPGLAPKRLAWDRAVFERRLEGANMVILPFKGLKVKLKGAPGALFAYMRLKSSTPFEDTLPPGLRVRFAAVRERLGEPAKHYGTKNPLAAGVMLISDYREQAQLTDAEPTKLVRYLAQQKRVPVEQRTYDVAPLLGAIAKTPASGGMSCLEEVLAEAVRGALAGERSYERCLNAAPGALAFDARAKADQAAAIAKALQRPGHSIAVVPLRTLLSQGGVLDRLRGQGFEVQTPGEEPPSG
jgi:uncharacterized protein YbaP (TraB family)